MSAELATLRNLRDGRAALERARVAGEVREIKRIHDIAAAAKRFAEAQQMSEDAKRFASEMELDSKRYLGEVLAKQEKHPPGPKPEDRFPEGTELPPKLSDLGVTKKQSHEAQKLADIPEDDYEDFKSRARSDTLNTKRALRVAREKDAERRREERSANLVVLPTGVDIRHGDLRTALADVADVDAIITDPPYPAKFFDEFDALGELAARALRPGGVLAAMVGQSHLPTYIERLSRHLPYRWCGAYLTEGPATRVHGRKVGTKWKPILLFGASEGFLTQDVFTSQRSDKEHHGWGQSESGFADLVERLTDPGALVVDPFLGGGTAAIVCQRLGRRFIGCDNDGDAVQTTRERLAA